MKDRFLFVDMETTGLEVADDLPLEVGLALVTKDMKIETSISVLINPKTFDINTRDQLESYCDDLVKEMHTKNGLFDDLYNVSATEPVLLLSDAQQYLLDWLERNGIPQGGLPMAGGNVANFDRPFIREFLLPVEKWFHYRNVDISSVKELCRQYNPRVLEHAPKKNQNHRVLDDIGDSIAELDYYLQEFLLVA